jgi:hypothetical protein
VKEDTILVLQKVLLIHYFSILIYVCCLRTIIFQANILIERDLGGHVGVLKQILGNT